MLDSLREHYIDLGIQVPEKPKRVQYQAFENRFKLMGLLGGKCSCDGKDCWHDGPCQVNDDRCLQIDHIHGGGRKDIERHRGNNPMVNYYLKHPDEAKSKLQVLCANCNWVKRSNNGEVAGSGNKSGGVE